MKRLLIVLTAVLAVALMLPLSFGPVELPPEQGGVAAADKSPGIAPVLDACETCSRNNCGCPGPSGGCSLSASCTCPSSGDCSVTCVYQCE
ncbi:MAG TPA: hypothetical protein VHQ65_08410 [Thermoanaerobaculia bacterium]|nr:hypothetical protein [Thermoanaerobaculia bacterium]